MTYHWNWEGSEGCITPNLQSSIRTSRVWLVSTGASTSSQFKPGPIVDCIANKLENLSRGDLVSGENTADQLALSSAEALRKFNGVICIEP